MFSAIGVIVVLTVVIIAVIIGFARHIESTNSLNAEREEREFSFFGNVITLVSLALPEIARGMMSPSDDEKKVVLVSIICLAGIILAAFTYYKKVLDRMDSSSGDSGNCGKEDENEKS